MKLLPKNTRVDPHGPMTLSLDVAVVMLIFFGAGFLLDRWLGTTPIFMIALTLIGAVGLFLRFKVQYDSKMEALEAQRRAPRRPAADPERAA